MNRPSHFFKYYTAGVAKIVLTTQRMRWNCPLNFKDPFDCFFSFETRFDPDRFRDTFANKYVELLLGAEEPKFDMSNPHAAPISLLRQNRARLPFSKEELKTMIAPSIDEGIEKVKTLGKQVREDWEKEAQGLRLLCVCEINDNLLLWSNYTDSHRGVVFQLECIKDLDVSLLIADPVIYADEAPGMATDQEWMDSLLGLRPFTKVEHIWRRLVTTKSRVWEHEKEWRVVTERRPYENKGFEDIPFSPREISKVFLGCRISEQDKDDILGLLSGPFKHVEAYQAHQNRKMYKVDFERVG